MNINRPFLVAITSFFLVVIGTSGLFAQDTRDSELASNEAELDRIYKGILSEITPASQKALSSAHSEWLKFRELECKWSYMDIRDCQINTTSNRITQLKETPFTHASGAFNLYFERWNEREFTSAVSTCVENNVETMRKKYADNKSGAGGNIYNVSKFPEDAFRKDFMQMCKCIFTEISETETFSDFTADSNGIIKRVVNDTLVPPDGKCIPDGIAGKMMRNQD